MLYISHLSFHDEREDGEPWHGYFTCVVEGDDVEAALGKTETLIRKLKAEEDVLEGVEAVYLESCVEIKAVPEEGFMASFQEWDGEVEGSVVTAVRGAGEESAAAYSWFPGEEEEDHRDGAGSDQVEEPFVEF